MRRWWVLVVVSIAQLMVLLDTTIVNIALPDAQADLGFTDADRQWIITAYTLAFGSLLFIGGRLMNVLGERRTLLIALAGFGIASALGGAASGFGTLATARALQGVFAALLMPTTLAVLTNTFSDPRERGRAFGIFGSIAGVGGSLGMVLGGVLTATVDWRWTLYVNLVFATLGVLGTAAFVRATPAVHDPARTGVDWAGAALSAAGSLLLVLGFSSAQRDGWDAAATIVFLAAGLIAFILFVLVERRVSNPILPLHVVLHRTRGASLIVLFIAGAALYATLLFVTYYFQRTLGLDPIRSGFAFLPQGLASFTIATLGGIFLLSKVSGRVLMPAGLVAAAAGLVLLGFVDVQGDYAQVVLPGLILLGAGLGLAFTVAFGLGLAGVAPRDAGAASAAVNAVMQLGGSIGTALLSTVAAAVATAFVAAHAPGAAHVTAAVASAADVHSYAVAFRISAAALFGAAVLTATLIEPARPAQPDAETTAEALVAAGEA